MHEYLKFPQKNYVGKRLSNERYIKSANLTNAEEKWLSAYLESIEILYSFPYNDGEIIVLLAEYTSVEHSKFSLNNFVMAVAQSLPYKILLIVRCEGVIRFFAFDEKTNQIDERRSRVFSVNSSIDIIPLEDDFFANLIISSLREAAIESTSAKELNARWYSALSGNADCGNSLIDDTFAYSVDKYHALVEKKKAFDKLTSDSFNEDVEDCLLYEGTPLEIDEVDHRFFAEFCAYHSRLLFDESSSLYAPTKNEWLKIYLDGCNSFAKGIFNRVLESKTVEIISKAFWYGNDDYIEAADCYDIDELKEHIGDYYFDEE